MYHPDEGNTYASFTFPGFIGAITGISSAGVALSQKAWVNVETDKATRSRIGYPTGFLLRDILQYSPTKEDAIVRAFSVRRTNAIFLGGETRAQWPSRNGSSPQRAHHLQRQELHLLRHTPAMDGILFTTKGIQPQDSTCIAG